MKHITSHKLRVFKILRTLSFKKNFWKKKYKLEPQLHWCLNINCWGEDFTFKCICIKIHSFAKPEFHPLQHTLGSFGLLAAYRGCSSVFEYIFVQVKSWLGMSFAPSICGGVWGVLELPFPSGAACWRSQARIPPLCRELLESPSLKVFKK